MPIGAVIFDLDDTLYPERAYNFSGFAAVAAAFEARLGNRHDTEAELRRLYDSGQRRRVFNTLLAGRGLPEDPALLRRMIEAYRTHRPTISLYPDAESALRRLRGRYKLGLITDGPVVMQSAKIDALEVRGRLDAVILTEELGAEFGKPHPRAFEIMATQLQVSATQCIYVADNAAKDFLAPNALHWTTVQVVRPEGIYRDRAPAANGGPTHVIETLDQLDALLKV